MSEAGKRLGVDVEQLLGLQFKSRDAYAGWLRIADGLAAAIEAEAVAARNAEIAAAVRGLERDCHSYSGLNCRTSPCSENVSRVAVLAIVEVDTGA